MLPCDWAQTRSAKHVMAKARDLWQAPIRVKRIFGRARTASLASITDLQGTDKSCWNPPRLEATPGHIIVQAVDWKHNRRGQMHSNFSHYCSVIPAGAWIVMPARLSGPAMVILVRVSSGHKTFKSVYLLPLLRSASNVKCESSFLL
eukprot:scaffold393_cov554-Prasinococcus_capsulatus_cf.AAC.5